MKQDNLLHGPIERSVCEGLIRINMLPVSLSPTNLEHFIHLVRLQVVGWMLGSLEIQKCARHNRVLGY